MTEELTQNESNTFYSELEAIKLDLKFVAENLAEHKQKCKDIVKEIDDDNAKVQNITFEVLKQVKEHLNERDDDDYAILIKELLESDVNTKNSIQTERELQQQSKSAESKTQFAINIFVIALSVINAAVAFKIFLSM